MIENPVEKYVLDINELFVYGKDSAIQEVAKYVLDILNREDQEVTKFMMLKIIQANEAAIREYLSN